MTQTIKGMDFEHEMTTTSHIFGRDADVHVVFEGDKAMTDKDVIILPAIDPMAEIDPAAAAIARGFVDHEAAHKRHTNFDVIAKMSKKYGEMGQHILNGIEDVRIAKKTFDEYVGAKDNINATARAVDERLLKGWEDGSFKERPAQDFLPLAIAWSGYEKMGLGHAAKCLANVDEEVAELARKIADQIDACESTEDAYEVAEWACKQIKLAEQEEEEEGEKEEGEGEGEGDADSKRVWNYDEFQPIGDADASGAVSEVLKGVTGGKHKPYRGCYEQDNMIDRHTPGTTFSTMHHQRAFKRAEADWSSRFMKITTQGGYVHAVKRRLEALLFAETERGWNPAQMAGRIDSKRLTQATLGSETVFKTRRGLPDIDTAVSVLVDMSGSMSGDKIELAADVATLLSEALHKTGCAFEVAGFHNVGHFFNRNKKLPPGFRGVDWDEVLKAYHATGHGGGRITKDEVEFAFLCGHAKISDWSMYVNRNQPMDYVTFKSWDERLSDARSSIQTIRQLAGGNNSDGDGLLEQYRRLNKRREKRKVMMVLSDGEPACGHNEASHLRRVTRMIQDERKVELVGIGIMDESVTHFYEKHAVCKRLSDLSTTVMDQLTAALKRGSGARKAA